MGFLQTFTSAYIRMLKAIGWLIVVAVAGVIGLCALTVIGHILFG